MSGEPGGDESGSIGGDDGGDGGGTNSLASRDRAGLEDWSVLLQGGVESETDAPAPEVSH